MLLSFSTATSRLHRRPTLDPASSRQPSTIAVRQLNSRDLQWLPALADLLIDGVHHGASLGFLAPLSRYAALDHWHGVFARLGAHQSLWIACETTEAGDEGPLQGAVQLSLCPRVNAHHRGEVQRLMVHSGARGRGIASQLMHRVEYAAAEQGRSLLVLETPAGSQAEAVYAHLGWQRAGEIPDYDACAEGRLHGSALYYKRLARLV
ncbi:GNAT family N-acetyltransferase [Roseateles violae]|uniref:GNAT family N-acetyltransferase n=1 Tax=Roseateles violae TaxID=3058042 RepID=A0ABT8DYM2_9BURK|nr:GNAT family N-acetyltransferase [Pelomonas sp. PFR6]MDN3922683.1 GNAT family N-acetyltransferase [Pelomonas sp. PFR6]